VPSEEKQDEKSGSHQQFPKNTDDVVDGSSSKSETTNIFHQPTERD
jgi:hypothetical protein